MSQGGGGAIPVSRVLHHTASVLENPELDCPDIFNTPNDELVWLFDVSPFRLTSLFNEIDENRDSWLSKKEFKKCLKILGIGTHAHQYQNEQYDYGKQMGDHEQHIL